MRIPIVDYYAVLGVHPSAEDVVIRAAYKALAQRYHPDRFAGSKDEAHRRMSELSKAYEVLADPMRRPKYDRRRRFTHPRSAAAGFGSSPKHASAALNPGDVRSAEVMRRRFRVAVATLMVVVGVLSAFNLFHHSPRLKEWLGAGIATTPSLPIRQGSATAPEPAIPKAEPSPSASAVPAAMTPASTSSVKERPRAETRSASIDRPAKNAPAAFGAAKTKAAPAPAGTCSQQQLLLGLCN